MQTKEKPRFRKRLLLILACALLTLGFTLTVRAESHPQTPRNANVIQVSDR